MFSAGNFAMARPFEQGIEEMGKKGRVFRVEETGGSRGWKGGYRKYRESGVAGSGLLCKGV